MSMHRNIIAEASTDDSGSVCSMECRFLIGYWCDCFRTHVGVERRRPVACIDAEIISEHKPTVRAGCSEEHGRGGKK